MSEAVPERGEIWLLNLDPTIGAEIRKTRPCVVISARVFNGLATRLEVPLTSWQPRFESHVNKVFVAATPQNGLSTDSAADVLQLRAVSTRRFSRRLGTVAAEVLAEICAGVVVAIDYTA